MTGKTWTLSGSRIKETDVRKINAILGTAMIVLFLAHMIMGGLQLAGIMPGGNSLMKIGAVLLFVLTMVHTVIGVILTAATLKARKKSGAGYFRENRLFWVRRISGFALMLFLVSHIMIFSGRTNGEVFRLNLFDIPQLISSLLFVASLLVHIVTNIRPLMLALGAGRAKDFLADCAFVLSVLLLAAGAAFVIYYFRWIM